MLAFVKLLDLSGILGPLSPILSVTDVFVARCGSPPRPPLRLGFFGRDFAVGRDHTVLAVEDGGMVRIERQGLSLDRIEVYEGRAVVDFGMPNPHALRRVRDIGRSAHDQNTDRGTIFTRPRDQDPAGARTVCLVPRMAPACGQNAVRLVPGFGAPPREPAVVMLVDRDRLIDRCLQNFEIDHIGIFAVSGDAGMHRFVDYGDAFGHGWSGFVAAATDENFVFKLPLERSGSGVDKRRTQCVVGPFTFLKFPAVVLLTIHRNVFPRPPEAEMVDVVGGQRGRPLKPRRRLQGMKKGTGQKRVAALWMADRLKLPTELVFASVTGMNGTTGNFGRPLRCGPGGRTGKNSGAKKHVEQTAGGRTGWIKFVHG